MGMKQRLATIADRVAASELDRIRLTRGQLVRVEGMPFRLESDTVVTGRLGNLEEFQKIKVPDITVGDENVYYSLVAPSHGSYTGPGTEKWDRRFKAEDRIDRIRLVKGQDLKINGIPFELESDTIVLGNRANLDMFKSKPSPDEAVGGDLYLGFR